MTKDNAPDVKIPESPQLAKLIAAGAVTATTFRGYVGPSRNEEYVSLYTSLDNLSESIEIARADILDFAEFSESGQPSGGMIVWVRKDAQVTLCRVETVGTASDAVPNMDSTQVSSGRLRIQVRPGLLMPSNCSSNCSGDLCHSNCS